MKMPEVWLRGPVEGVPPLLQPVAHALLQAGEEVEAALAGFPDELLSARPAGVASVAFHLKHMAGVVDRLFTYARGEGLSGTQLQALAAEGEPGQATTRELVDALHRRIEQAVEALQHFDEATLTTLRGVGRKKLPSTVGGLLFHAAEHTMRHLGQMLVTARVVQGARGE